MIEEDTVKLLRECDAGIEMGVSSIADVMGAVKSEKLRSLLTDSRREHEKLRHEVTNALERFHESGKEPNPIAKGMSEVKTGVRLAINASDSAVADLMTDGCNMGIKSLHRYLNQYKAADESSKNIAKRLANIEERLVIDIRTFL